MSHGTNMSDSNDWGCCLVVKLNLLRCDLHQVLCGDKMVTNLGVTSEHQNSQGLSTNLYESWLTSRNCSVGPTNSWCTSHQVNQWQKECLSNSRIFYLFHPHSGHVDQLPASHHTVPDPRLWVFSDLYNWNSICSL